MLYGIYVFGIWQNPPGYYVDESALSYNAYLVSQTGAGESGEFLPLFFPVYSDFYTQYANPTQIYLLAVVFKIFGPGILTARLFASACVFVACLLLGLLAKRITGKISVGLIVGITALLTPWLFEVGRLVLETFFYPMAVVLLLWSVYRVSGKDRWGLLDAAFIALSLALLTYSYTIGRLLAPLLAGGLIVFAVNRNRIFSVLKVWVLFGLTFVPLLVYIKQNRELTARFSALSYIKPDSTFGEILSNFAFRFVQDINPLTMVLEGDSNPRHHLFGVLGSFYLAAFILAAAGIVIVLWKHQKNSWWWYVILGLFASAVPGALTTDPFHMLRMIAYPVFLITLTIPALDWLTGADESKSEERKITGLRYAGTIRAAALAGVLTFGAVEAGYFHGKYYLQGADRGEYFDAGYKPLYDEAIAMPNRPIYLVDGYWGPAYVHAFWYATLDGRDIGGFIHQPYRTAIPDGAVVISSEKNCRKCEIIRREDGFILYFARDE